MKNRVSVIVPIYNVDKFLRKCIDSILNQTYKELEIILVDDGSTDKSGEICDEYSNRFTNISTIHKKNGGLSSARNAGLDIATGEYVSFIDSDDFIESNMYEKMVNAIQKSGKDIATCGRYVDIYGLHENIEFNCENQKEYTKTQAIKSILHFSKIDVSACDKLYKRKLFEEIRYPEGRISEDAAVIFNIIDKTNGVVHAGEPFYHYVFREKSISKSKYNEKNLDVLWNLKNTKKFISNNYSELIDDFKIYACITASAQIALMFKDKNARKKFKKEYKELMTFFNDGYSLTMKAKDVNFKKKIEFFFNKHHMIKLYFLIKKIYQIKYKI